MGKHLISWGSHGAVPMATATTGSSFPVYSGPVGAEAQRFTKWVFHLGPNPEGSALPTGYTVSIYGTNDGNAINDEALVVSATGVPTYQTVGAPNANYPAPGASGESWFLLPAESEQSGTGLMTNPLTAVGNSLYYNGPLLVVCCVITSSSPTGGVTVFGYATP